MDSDGYTPKHTSPEQRPAATATGDPERDFCIKVYDDEGTLVAFYPLYDCPINLLNQGYWTVENIHGATTATADRQEVEVQRVTMPANETGAGAYVRHVVRPVEGEPRIATDSAYVIQPVCPDHGWDQKCPNCMPPSTKGK